MASQAVTLRVLVAGTGVTYKIALHPSELTVANLRAHLAAAVPLSEQILLLGPPYKVPKDATIQSEEIRNALRLGDIEDDPIPEHENDAVPRKILATTERAGARRLFLFSKRALSEASSADDALETCHLEPVDLVLPMEAPGPSPLHFNTSLSPTPPLYLALEAYERQFMLYLAQGRVLADGADLRLKACRTCVQEQAVMARALRAAVSNLADHYHTATRTRAEFTASFQSKLAAHNQLLQQFESILENLATVPLHPSLVSVARASGRVVETLLDTVPVDKERAWAQQCQVAHQRLASLFSELDAAFGETGTAASREEEARQDRLAETEIQTLWETVEVTAKAGRDRQGQRVERLTADHSQVVKIIVQALEADNGGSAQAAFAPLGEKSKSSQEVVPAMLAEDALLKDIMLRVAAAKTQVMKRMKVRLREISRAQSNIQRVLSSVGVLRDAMTQQVENMAHLEHVAELVNAYSSFLSEVRRRRAYGQAVSAVSRATLDRLATLRSDEVKAREKFLRGPGRHLMPAFFEFFAPTLATPPPLFTPQMPAMVELDTLPDVGNEDSTVQAEDTEMHHHSVPSSDHPGGIGSTSSLTAESQAPAPVTVTTTTATPVTATSDGGDPMMASALNPMGAASSQQAVPGPTTGSTPVQLQQQQDHLIVSADEHSGEGSILEGGVTAEAERKTLAYENAVLRQTIERLGGKPPKAYIAEARQRDAANSGMEDDDVAALRKELAEAKAQAKLANEALQQVEAANKGKDRISHRSFDVGDVGLFMPTGRGSAGKRTYLAFHSNCPHRYLATDCIKGSPDFVLGRIVFQEKLIAGEIGTDANPYGLQVGTVFWVLTIEVLK